MRVAFLHSDKPRERVLADAFLLGAAKHGHQVFAEALGEESPPGTYDVVAMVGVKSRERWREQHRAGAHMMLFDKGYSRQKGDSPRAGWEFWRVAIDAHHPTARLEAQESPPDRLASTGWELKPWREHTKTGPIILAGSSAKYHDFYGLSHPTKYARAVVEQIREVTERRIIYRPKPSWHDAEPLQKADYSLPPETMADLLKTAHVLVTHGSNACFEAVLAGVPCIVLGDGVAKPLSSTDLERVEKPRLASDKERLRWAANLAWWQFSEAEHASGLAWDFLGEQLHG